MSDIKHSGFVAGTGEYITASTTADLAAEIDALRAELAAANAEAARLRGIIQKAEWGKSVHTAWDKYQRCAVCGNKQSSGHDVNCPFYQWEASHG